MKKRKEKLPGEIYKSIQDKTRKIVIVLYVEQRKDNVKTVLFINGCIRGENSRTLKLFQVYVDALTKTQKVNFIERNLGNGAVSFYTEKSFDSETGELKIQKDWLLAEEFAAADEIVLAAPYWEFAFPAAVSSYLEKISVPGITFKYTNEGSRGLCRAKAFTYIYSAGNYLTDEDKIGEKLLRQLSKLYGISQFDAILSEGLDIEGNNPDEILKHTCEKIRISING